MKINPNKIKFTNVTRTIDLIIPAQNAKLTPPVGPVLGQFRIKVKFFCDDFNKETLIFPYGLPLQIYVYVYQDLTFHYVINAPTIMFFIKNMLLKVSNTINKLLELYKIILIKKQDLKYLSLLSILKTTLATIKSMNIKL